MPALELCLLGPFEASLDGRSFTDFRTKKVQALLVYLSVERDRSHGRESLMDLLWPGMPLDSAQVNLRQTIYRLRQALPEVESREDGRHVPLLLADRQSVQLNPEADVLTDVALFLETIEQDPEGALSHYRSDFLSDFFLVDSSTFENWAQTLRQQYRGMALAALSQLAQKRLQDGEFRRAQIFAWRQIEIDPLEESAYRQLMAALAGSGQRSSALQQYQILARRLKEKLGIEPAGETRRLYEEIRADEQHRGLQAAAIQARGKSHMPVFLLTDIEGSTELWDTYRQSMLAALMQHNAILEEQIEKHGGRILEMRGDGVKAVFEAGRPLESVIAIQKTFAQVNWGEIGSLRTRIGLHGVPSVHKDFDYFQDDDRYFGPVLNHTARIMSAGWGGQILVSEQVHNAFPLPAGASWVDYGVHELRSLEQPVHIFGLTHPDLPDQAFPPLQTMTHQKKAAPQDGRETPQNLPIQATRFVGRLNELAELERLLSDPALHHLTIVGPGGIGKTRLALALGHRALESQGEYGAGPFPDGVFFIALASLNQIDQVIPEISRALNVPAESSPTSENWQRDAHSASRPLDLLISHLKSRRMLIILDNFEHLVEGAGIISELHEKVPGLKTLATSREQLQIRQEQVFPISGLAFPDWETPENLMTYTSIELFLQSARRVRPGFELEPEDGVYLARISRLVEGMPLGLEIAASWVDTLSVQEIAEEIRNSLDFLEADFRDLPDRHRSMRAIFDSTWSRLVDQEKTAFARLSIFRAPFNRAAAEEIGRVQLRTLASLVSKSLLQLEGESGCYQIHEVLRQYGAEQLASNPEEAQGARRRHSAYFCREIENHLQVFMSGKTQIGITLIENDFSNIRAAWDWAVRAGEIESANRALIGLCMYYDWLWHINDGLAATRAALEMVSSSGRNPAAKELSLRLQTRALAWQGYFNFYFRENQAAVMLEESRQAADALREMGAEAGLEFSLVQHFTGLMHYLTGDPKKSIAFIETSLSISQEKQLHWMIYRNLMTLGNIAQYSGSLREAKIWYEKGLAESRAAGNKRGEINALNNLGWTARRMLDYDGAWQYYEKCLQLAIQHHEQWEASNAYESLGFQLIFFGKFKQSIPYFEQAIEASKHLGQPFRLLSSQVHIGVSKWMSGEFAAAEEDIQRAVKIAAGQTPNAQVFPSIALVEYLAITGRYAEARSRFDEMKGLVREVFVGRFLDARLPRVLGWLALAGQHWQEAREHFEKSIEMYRQDADDEQVAWSQAGLAAAAIQEDRMAEAKDLLTEALWTTIEIQGFIPLIFTLPVVCLYFARNDPESAGRLYWEIQASPFLRNAPLFHDIAYKYLPDDMIVASGPEMDPISDSALREHLWSTASRVLSTWMQPWLEDPAALPQ